MYVRVGKGVPFSYSDTRCIYRGMYAYLMAVSASGAQQQDRDFYRGAPATGKAVCVADTCPAKTLPACGTRTRARQSRHMHNKLKGAGGKKTENGTKACRNADDSGDQGRMCTQPCLSRGGEA
jgi:hypothetical protein